METVWFVHDDRRLYESIESILRQHYIVVEVNRGLFEDATDSRCEFWQEISRLDIVLVAFYRNAEWYLNSLRVVAERSKVIVWSGHHLEFFEAESLAAGARKVVSKNAGIKVFLAAIEEVLRAR